MKLIVVVTMSKTHVGFIDRVDLLLPHQYDMVDELATPHSLFYMEVSDDELLPYALNIVGSRGGEAADVRA
jgi:hypothetical protein